MIPLRQSLDTLGEGIITVVPPALSSSDTRIEESLQLTTRKEPSLSHNPSLRRHGPRKGSTFRRRTSIAEMTKSQEEMVQLMHEMPECAEQTLILLQSHFQTLSTAHQQLDEKGVRDLCERLLHQHAEEELGTKALFLDQLPTMQECLLAHQAGVAGEVFEGVFDDAAEKISAALASLRPIDMGKLIRYVKQTESAANTIKGKDVILFLGGSGSGKSTTIHFLAGSEMRQVVVDGLDHVEPVKVFNQHLANVKSSPHARSETRFITAVPVSLRGLDPKGSGEVILCDTPGFNDSSGPEVDIANGIGIVKAVRQCRSVKPVLLISEKGLGDRSDGLLQLAVLMDRFVANLRDHVPKFSFLFTKFKADANVTSLAADLLKQDRHNMAKSFKVLLMELAKQSKSGAARKLLPTVDSPLPVLQFLVDQGQIDNPDKVFTDFVTGESRQMLTKQIREYDRAIAVAIKRR